MEFCKQTRKTPPLVERKRSNQAMQRYAFDFDYTKTGGEWQLVGQRSTATR